MLTSYKHISIIVDIRNTPKGGLVKMKFTKTTVDVDGTSVEVITESGDGIYLIPGEQHAFQIHNGRRIAGTSFQAFGSDANRASELEQRWVKSAQDWWDTQI